MSGGGVRDGKADQHPKVRGRDWPFLGDWVAFLEGISARTLAHDEIARHIQDTGLASGWWAQSITVAYEQHIGRRVPGQDRDGTFLASISKTCSGTLDGAFARWVALLQDRTQLGGIDVNRAPETSASEKWRYWRCDLKDSSRVIVAINQRAPGKVMLAVQHERLPTADQAAHWRTFWRRLLKGF